ncbi:hypothetical protein HYC85_000495 [Camellia sinensis]|uniref:Uncharacterized protein n=1 Tax=Camellia sinensis TaxID=4442 RepID=A0A7J7I486_CAMSI|nr:hypothetical protein HYC85_000495 [Camellia sinensis]
MRLHQIKEGKSSMHHSKLTQSQLGWHREESPIICKLIPRSLVRNQTQQEKKKKKKKKKKRTKTKLSTAATLLSAQNHPTDPYQPSRHNSSQQGTHISSHSSPLLSLESLQPASQTSSMQQQHIA